jgi:hypothetical protein
MKQNKTLKNLFPLDHSIKLYIPSTIETNKPADNSKQVDEAMKLFSSLFGGATSYEAVGAWTDQGGKLVKEKIVVVQSFATAKQVDENIMAVIKHAQHLKNEMSQEAISLEYDNKLSFI